MELKAVDAIPASRYIGAGVSPDREGATLPEGREDEGRGGTGAEQ